MVTAVGLLGLLVIVFLNGALTALMTRFFRVRMRTRWGGVLYSVLLCPFAMFIVFVVLATLGFGGDLELGTGTALTLTILVPLIVGMTFDYVWMPSPGEVDLPATAD
jgi:hypothetical protein